MSLLHAQKYVIYVKTWLTSDVFVIYQSNSIIVDHTPPSQRRGKTVKDSNEHCVLDFDDIDWNDTITSCWKDVFAELQGHITHFTVSLGVSFHHDDVLPATNVGLATNLTLRNLSLSYGTKYFFTVTAYNNVGLFTSIVSDGFVVDMDQPVAGVVFNTMRHHDKFFQSDPEKLSFSWHGFEDSFSGIRHYYIALTEKKGENDGSNEFLDVGLKTSITLANLTLKHGQTYYGIVKAVDNVGHSSDIIMSNGVLVDLSPPVGQNCNNFTLVHNLSEELSGRKQNNISFSIYLKSNTMYIVHGSLFGTDLKMTNLLLNVDRFQVQLQTVMHHDGSLHFEFPFLSPVSSLTEISLYLRQELDLTAEVSVLVCSASNEDNKSVVILRQISPSAIAVNTFVVDEESSLKKIMVGAGTSKGGFQIKPLTRINHRATYEIIQTRVPHGTPVHVTAIAENRAGLTSVFYADKLTIDHTGPLLTDLETILNTDNNTISVEATWKVSDDESGLKYCLCSVGEEPTVSNLQDYWLADNLMSCSSKNLSLQHGDTIYLNVKCINKVEIVTEMSSQPMVISIEEPDMSSAVISFIPLNDVNTVYTSEVESDFMVQSNRSALLIRWSGIDDPSGIERFEYRILSGMSELVNWTSTDRKQMAGLHGCHLADGNVTAEVRAVNSGQHISDSVVYTMGVAGSPPQLTGHDMMYTRKSQSLLINWGDVFITATDVPFSYSVVIGTRFGYTDLLDIGFTRAHSMIIELKDSTIITPHVKEIFIDVTCTYSTGLSVAYHTSYKIA